MNWLDYLQPKANQAAVLASQAAIEQAAKTPFSVVLSVEQGTQVWITVLLVALGGVLLLKK